MAAGDLAPGELARLLPGRPIRSYPALLSTEADATAWARDGAEAGSVVVADYQAAPRGRAGLPWKVTQGTGLGFSLVVRPALTAAEEGWLYTVATVALADVVTEATGDEAAIEWPDEVHVDGAPAAAVGITSELGVEGVVWAVVTVLVHPVSPPRGRALARCVAAIEQATAGERAAVLDSHRRRCATLGRRVQARLIPMGPGGVRIEGRAVDVLGDGALLVETDRGARAAVLPHHVGFLDDVDDVDE